MSNAARPVEPKDGIRLPEALVINHGPAQIISRLFVAGDNMAVSLGLKLRYHSDFQPLLDFNLEQTKLGAWYPLPDHFDPRIAIDMTPGTAFWISAEDAEGRIVATQGARIYHWPTTTFAEEARLMFFGGREIGQLCDVDNEVAHEITGYVHFAGGLWVHPDYRNSGLSSLMSHSARALAAARWPLNCSFCIMKSALTDKGVAARYGYKDITKGLRYPKTANWGDLDFAICRMSPSEYHADFIKFSEDWEAYLAATKAQKLEVTKVQEPAATKVPRLEPTTAPKEAAYA